MIIPSGFAHVQHLFTGVALPEGAAITYGFAPNGGSFDPGDATLLQNLLIAQVLPEMSSEITLVGTVVKYGPNEDGPRVEIPANTVGGASGATAPPNVALLVRKVTALGGRKNRGRMYVPGIREGNIDGAGVVASANRTTFQGDWDAFLAGVQALAADMVILHNDSTTPTVVTDLIVDGRVATQRRRLR